LFFFEDLRDCSRATTAASCSAASLPYLSDRAGTGPNHGADLSVIDAFTVANQHENLVSGKMSLKLHKNSILKTTFNNNFNKGTLRPDNSFSLKFLRESRSRGAGLVGAM
jgi:hypothetical protein